MKATITLEINNKRIELTLLEALELREQLNKLTGIGEVDEKKKVDHERTAAIDTWKLQGHPWGTTISPYTYTDAPLFTTTTSSNAPDDHTFTIYGQSNVLGSRLTSEMVSDIKT